jgi:integrase
VRFIRASSQGHHSWTQEEIEQFQRRHPLGSKPHLALMLMLLTGVRKSDAVRLGRQHERGGKLVFTAAKNAHRKPVRIEIPILPELQAVLDGSPTGSMCYLETAYQKPFTPAGFGMRFRRWCDQAGLPHCSAHGLRKAGAATAAEGGASEAQLMAIFGWTTTKEPERYTRAANRAKMARDAMGLLVKK